MKYSKGAKSNKWVSGIRLGIMIGLPLLFLIVLLTGLQRVSLGRVQAASELRTRNTTTDRTALGSPSLTTMPGWDSVKVIDPVVILDSGLYKMWYSGQSSDGKLRVGYATSPDGVNWTKYLGNPILDVGVGGSWDGEAVRVNAVIKDGSSYRMWFTGGLLPSRLGYATSPDGINWTKYPGNPVLDVGPASSWDEGLVGFSGVISDAAIYKMWYTGVDSLGFSGGVGRLGYATSPDGISWTKHPGNPVLDVGSLSSWDESWVFDPHVISDSVSLMWYSGLEGQLLSGSEVLRIGLATSPDGIAWTKSTSNPVLDITSAGWDNQSVTAPWVIFDGNMYHMWYHGGEITGVEMIGYATSMDGVSWTKYAGNPVLRPSQLVYLPLIVKN